MGITVGWDFFIIVLHIGMRVLYSLFMSPILMTSEKQKKKSYHPSRAMNSNLGNKPHTD